ncbi:MAG: cytochrome c [Nitrospiraceae bacterium]
MNVRATLSVLLLVTGCSSWVAAQVVGGNPQAGQMVYEKNCLRCHGENLDGAGLDGQYLIVRPTDL